MDRFCTSRNEMISLQVMFFVYVLILLGVCRFRGWAASSQSFQSDGSPKNRALGYCPSSHSCTTPPIGLKVGYA